MASKEEIEELATLKTEVKHLQTDVSAVKKSVASLDAKFDTVIEKMEQRYASKWVEKALIGVIVFVFTALGGAVLGSYIKDEPAPTTVQVAPVAK